MFLPRKLFKIELERNDSWKNFLRYQTALRKSVDQTVRLKFLDNCLKSHIVPKFLKFRIPNNDRFDDKLVHDFQIKLLRKEIFKANTEKLKTSGNLEETRNRLKTSIPRKCIPSLVLYTRHDNKTYRNTLSTKHNDKLFRLSKEQEILIFKTQ